MGITKELPMKCVKEEVFEISNNHGLTWYLVRLFGIAVLAITPTAPSFWIWCVRETGETGAAIEHQVAVQNIVRKIAALAVLALQVAVYVVLLMAVIA